MKLESLIEEADNIIVDDIDYIIEGFWNLINNGFFDRVDIEGGLARLDNVDEAFIFGDIHGDFDTFVSFLRRIDLTKPIIFLGDVLDRGAKQLQCLKLIVLLSRETDILFIRGNHEPPNWLIPYPHDFPSHLKWFLKDRWRIAYNAFLKIFDNLPHAGVINDEILLVHGGIPITADSLNDFINPDKNILTEILWNDPFEGYGFMASDRGVGYLFGIDITKTFLDSTGLRAVVRGHQPVDGYRVMHRGRLATIFSRVGYPYANMKASIFHYRRGFNGFRDEDFIDIVR